MKTILYLLMICILLTTVAGYNNNEIVDLYKIEECSGPVDIRVQSDQPLKDGEISIEGLVKTNNIWSGDCTNNFLIRFRTLEHTHNTYNFLIQYYTEYKDVEAHNNTIPSNEEVFNEEHKMEKRFDKLYIGDKDESNKFSFNIETKNTILFSILIFIFIVIIVYIKVVIPHTKSDKYTDVLNYSVKNRDKNDDTKEILKYIK